MGKEIGRTGSTTGQFTCERMKLVIGKWKAVAHVILITGIVIYASIKLYLFFPLFSLFAHNTHTLLNLAGIPECQPCDYDRRA